MKNFNCIVLLLVTLFWSLPANANEMTCNYPSLQRKCEENDTSLLCKLYECSSACLVVSSSGVVNCLPYTTHPPEKIGGNHTNCDGYLSLQRKCEKNDTSLLCEFYNCSSGGCLVVSSSGVVNCLDYRNYTEVNLFYLIAFLCIFISTCYLGIWKDIANKIA